MPHVDVIRGVATFPDGREVCRKDSKWGRGEYISRTMTMRYRQDELCAICGEWMDPYDTTFDHEGGRGMSGFKRDDRTSIDGKPFNAAVHCNCNSAKGSRRFHWDDNGKYIEVKR